MNITDFLIARITEDEQEYPHRIDCFLIGGGETWCSCNLPARWDAECAAKRKLLALHERSGLDPRYYDGLDAQCELCSNTSLEGLTDHNEPWPCPSLQIMAAPYAAHPDFDPSWGA